MLKVRNVGDRPFVGRYRQQWIEVPAGVDMFLETGAIHAWLGNPATKDTTTWRQREEEFQRVRLMWCGELLDTPGAWEERKPSLEVYTVEGERYWTVADDPDGTVHAGTEMSPDVDKESLIAAVRELQARIAQLETPKVEPVVDSPAKKPPTDNPRVVKVG